ncbi:hypothetical protein JRQ81_011173 [Phrynocephalus forsythii]|uniref:Alpha-2B adrenergic receptor n=1 Tax=Phrynocephalus forsythii TaxID=171643 RepID=A0A9Q0X8I5_9SAUR|nr:hypothetical protein JRQ81_011173 [Phrynocephalus forsythii]
MVTMGGHEGYNTQATAAIAAVTTFLILFTIFGNVLVIIAVLTSRSLKAPQNLFLVSLAAADILVATLIIPFSLANELMGYWYFDKVWCKAYLALDVLFCTASIVHLCAISLDRYWSVSQAIEYNAKRTPRRIKGTILLVWLIAALISLPPLVVNENPKHRKEDAQRCELNEQPWYILSSSTCSFFAPCLIMILVYLRIYFIAKRRSRKGANAKTPKAKPGEEASQIMGGLSRESSPKEDPLKNQGEPNGHQVPIQGDNPSPETQILPPASQEEKGNEPGTMASPSLSLLPPGSSRSDCSPAAAASNRATDPHGARLRAWTPWPLPEGRCCW